MTTLQELSAKLENMSRRYEARFSKQDAILQCVLTRMEAAETFIKEFTTEVSTELMRSEISVKERLAQIQLSMSEMKNEIYQLLDEAPISFSESSAADCYVNEDTDQNSDTSDAQHSGQKLLAPEGRLTD